jgi:hypothetical protein
MNFQDFKRFLSDDFSFIQYLMYFGCKNINNLTMINELSLQLFHKSVNSIYINIACHRGWTLSYRSSVCITRISFLHKSNVSANSLGYMLQTQIHSRIFISANSSACRSSPILSPVRVCSNIQKQQTKQTTNRE